MPGPSSPAGGEPGDGFGAGTGYAGLLGAMPGAVVLDVADGEP
jgi:hypothetical protein